MAEPLKNQFGVEIPRTIARMISRVFPSFEHAAFINEALEGYEALDLMQRGKKIASTLRRYLPDSYPEAVGILLHSLGPKLQDTQAQGMSPFLYLPHVSFVAEYGLDFFEVSMTAQYELTQRFTAEFCIRPYLEQHTVATLARLKEWANDPSPHVRRLVSEGTRPRLPWAPRLREFQKDPRPVLELLELLKDDSDLYVRRSVANNLNDIGKDHPELLVEITRRWMQDASEERRWLVSHALRSAVKRAEAGALDVMGFGAEARVEVGNIHITPRRALMGGSVEITFEVRNTAAKNQRVLVDMAIHFVKANGKTNPKVFKLRAVNLAPNETAQLRKTVSLAEMTTRKHYAGIHKVDVVLNGRIQSLGEFVLVKK